MAKKAQEKQSKSEELGSQEPVSFENALEELETVVEQLEGGELTLEESLALYERGIALGEHCQKSLDAAEQKVLLLTSRSNDEVLDDYEGADHDG